MDKLQSTFIMLYKREKERIIERYNEKLKKNPKEDLLSTGSKIRREIRYQVLTEIGNLQGKRVLDLGCGIGDFWQYLIEKKIECEYVGYDINPNIVKIAKERFPNVRFEVKDVLLEDFPNFDYIVSTSSFNNKFKYISNYEFIAKLLEILYEHINSGGVLR